MVATRFPTFSFIRSFCTKLIKTCFSLHHTIMMDFDNASNRDVWRFLYFLPLLRILWRERSNGNTNCYVLLRNTRLNKSIPLLRSSFASTVCYCSFFYGFLAFYDFINQKKIIVIINGAFVENLNEIYLFVICVISPVNPVALHAN